MTRMRTILFAVSLAVIAIAALTAVCGKRDLAPPLAATLLRYDYARNVVVIQITNRTGFDVGYLCMGVGPIFGGAIQSNVPPHAAGEFTLPMLDLGQRDSASPSVRLVSWRTPSKLRRQVSQLLYALGIRSKGGSWHASVDLPPPPPLPLP